MDESISPDNMLSPSIPRDNKEISDDEIEFDYNPTVVTWNSSSRMKPPISKRQPGAPIVNSSAGPLKPPVLMKIHDEASSVHRSAADDHPTPSSLRERDFNWENRSINHDRQSNPHEKESQVKFGFNQENPKFGFNQNNFQASSHMDN